MYHEPRAFVIPMSKMLSSVNNKNGLLNIVIIMKGLKAFFQNGSHHSSIMPKLMSDSSEPCNMM